MQRRTSSEKISHQSKTLEQRAKLPVMQKQNNYSLRRTEKRKTAQIPKNVNTVEKGSISKDADNIDTSH